MAARKFGLLLLSRFERQHGCGAFVRLTRGREKVSPKPQGGMARQHHVNTTEIDDDIAASVRHGRIFIHKCGKYGTSHVDRSKISFG